MRMKKRKGKNPFKKKNPKMVQFALHVDGGDTFGELTRSVERMYRRRLARRNKLDKDYRGDSEYRWKRQ